MLHAVHASALAMRQLRHTTPPLSRHVCISFLSPAKVHIPVTVLRTSQVRFVLQEWENGLRAMTVEDLEKVAHELPHTLCFPLYEARDEAEYIEGVADEYHNVPKVCHAFCSTC